MKELKDDIIDAVHDATNDIGEIDITYFTQLLDMILDDE